MYLYYENKDNKKEVILISTEKMGGLSNYVEAELPKKEFENVKLYIDEENKPYWKEIKTAQQLKNEELEETLTQVMMALTEIFSRGEM